MVAVLTVFANHLWGWPSGGFVGVDVFFVISGFLITGNLLRTADTTGTVSFTRFYWNRARRIVPAATVVLVVTFLAATLLFLPFRSRQVGIDALFAFVFAANWHFAAQGTDYFNTVADTVSPIQHYWSLSIEEQFYLVWPALIFIISVLVIRKGWTHTHRMQLAGGVMGVIVAASLAWALYETTTAPTWAYFNTFARVWELGVGALLATAIGLLTRIPRALRPVLSWGGLLLIAASMFLIGDTSSGFPAPWALLPVAGASLVIAAGVGGEPRFQGFLRNPVSCYIGDISYSLYLVHWPVIVLLGAIMDDSWYFYFAAVTLSSALAIGSYHFVENPLRHADSDKARTIWHDLKRRRFHPQRSTGYAAIGALTLLVVASVAYMERPEAYRHAIPPRVAAASPAGLNQSAQGVPLGPLASALQTQIVAALQADDWPALNPTIESIINDQAVSDPGIPGCSGTVLQSDCTWGSPTAATRIVVVGNSVAAYYVQPLREIALASNGQLQVHTEAMPGCNFLNDLITTDDESYMNACPGRKQQAIDYINRTKPDVVIISNNYVNKQRVGSDREMTPGEWSKSMSLIVEQIRPSTKKIVFLSPPPGDVLITDCYGKRGNTPADCIGKVTPTWNDMADAEQQLASTLGGVWIDSRPWFCSSERLCPSFVETTPTKLDRSHILPAYGLKISPVMGESFRAAGVF